MDNDALKEYIPVPGDLIALKHFLGSSEVRKKGKKQSLMEKLKTRLLQKDEDGKNDDGIGSSNLTQIKKKKQNAEKSHYMVELGWMHWSNAKHDYIQVRTKKGGGTRYVRLSKKDTRNEIITEAKKLFFPNSISPIGGEKDMIFDLTDFKCQSLTPPNTTIEDMVNIAKLPKLRFYLSTKLISDLSDDNELPDILGNDTDELPDILGNDIDADPGTSQDSGKSGDNTEPALESSFKEVLTELQTSNPQNISNDSLSEIINMSVDTMSRNLSDQVLGTTSPILHTSTPETMWEDSLGEIQIPGWSGQSDRQPKPVDINVHRGHILRDLRALFKCTPDIDFKRDIITFSVTLPNGEKEQADDNGGVMRDAISEFWDSFYEECTLGRDIKVPCLRHDYQAEDWIAVAHVIAMGWILQKIFPIRLAPSFLHCVLYGMEMSEDSSKSIIEEFLMFIPDSERVVLQQALSDFDNTEMEDLQDVLSNHECKVLINKQNIKSIVSQIARKELIQEPSFIKECFFNTLMTYGLEIDLNTIIEKLTPTTKKILAILDCEENEAPSFKLLKKYIRELDDVNLSSFLRFTTSSNLMLYDTKGEYYRLIVRIVDISGLQRRPIAHTCGRVLEIPKAYENYPQFRIEFNKVLKSNVWVMDIH